MKSLAASNRYLQTAAVRNSAVERNVRSSSAIEGVSAGVFRSAVKGRFVAKAKRASHTAVVNGPRPRKKK
jgi:hypothetical protein